VLLPALLQRRLERVVPVLEHEQRWREDELYQLRGHRLALLQWHHEDVVQHLQDLHVVLLGLEEFWNGWEIIKINLNLRKVLNK
jgi:hypothetical protein